jgi:hypothetical protein
MSDDVSISQTNADVSSAIARANQAEASGLHSDRAAAATAALTAWADARRTIPSATPKDAVEAGQRLQHLEKDPAWRNSFAAGDSATVKEFHALTDQIASGDAVSLALAGVSPAASVDQNSGSLVGERDLPAAVNHLRDRGYTDMHVREILTGELLADDGSKLSEAQIAERVANAERLQERLGRDAEWRRKYLSGDRDAAAVLGAVTATIAAGKRS